MRKYSLLLFLALFSFSAIHAEVDWSLSADGTLTISGTDMPNYEYGSAPWYSQRESIKKNSNRKWSDEHRKICFL